MRPRGQKALARSETLRLPQKGSGPWADLALTLPIFLGYHLGVIFLPLRNAADVVTRELVALANNSLLTYGGLTLGIGVLFVGTLMLLGRGQTLRWERFALVVLEAIVYAVAMRILAGFVIGQLQLYPGNSLGLSPSSGWFMGAVMSLGAGFYEEVAFRVILFGLGLKLLAGLAGPLSGFKRTVLSVGWAFAAAFAFSFWHYLGALGEPFELPSLVFRWVCGLVFTLIYAYRGFAPAVWTHTLYDAWVLVL